jgi:hypothetical protein
VEVLLVGGGDRHERCRAVSGVLREKVEKVEKVEYAEKFGEWRLRGCGSRSSDG